MVVNVGARTRLTATALLGPHAAYSVAGADGRPTAPSAQGEGGAGAPAASPSLAATGAVGAAGAAEAAKLDRAAHAAYSADVRTAWRYDEAVEVAEVLLLRSFAVPRVGAGAVATEAALLGVGASGHVVPLGATTRPATTGGADTTVPAGTATVIMATPVGAGQATAVADATAPVPSVAASGGAPTLVVVTAAVAAQVRPRAVP